MLKFITPLLFAAVSYFIMPYFPWYCIGLLALVLAAFASGQSILKTFGIYFAIGFGLWYSMSMMNDSKSGSLLSSRIGVLFGNQSKGILLTAAGLIGGITSGLGGMLGNSIHGLFFSKVPTPVK